MGFIGKAVNSIFGGGSNKQFGKAIDFQKEVYNENKLMATPFVEKGLAGYGKYMDALTGTDDTAYKNWLNSSDYNFVKEEGEDSLTHFFRAKGLGTSGAILKAGSKYVTNLANSYRQNWLDNLLSGATLGTGVLGNLMGANQNAAEGIAALRAGKAQGAANGVGNALNFGLGVASLISDRRLKTNIVRVGEFPDGLGIYRYSYALGGDSRVGVMADEVEALRPWALGPVVDGYKTVNYGEL